MYATIVPPWQAPEEPWHFEVARLRYEYGRAVKLTDRSPELYSQILDSMRTFHFWEWVPRADPNPQGGEFHQQPLYYQLLSIILALVPESSLLEQLFLLRLATVMLGLLVVVLSYYTTKLVFPDDTFMKIGVPAFIAFLPTYTYSIGTLNNDRAAEVAVTLTLFFLVLMLRKGPSLFGFLGAAFSLTMGYFSKRTFIFAIPLSVIGVILAIWLHREKKEVYRLLAFGFFVTVLGVMLGVENRTLVSGWMYKLFGRFDYGSGAIDLGEMIRILRRVYPQYARGLFQSFWGMFGWGAVRLGALWFWLLGLVCLTSILGLAWLILKQPQSLEPWQYTVLALYVLALLLNIGLAVVSKLDQQTSRWPETFLARTGPPQARYIFPSLLPIATLFTLGFRAWIPAGRERLGLISYTLGLVGLDAVSVLGYILPFFYGSSILDYLK